ncbi:hypothetical protein BGX34_001418 [Mortierella sp. NVP85]|nr:hypothetical protein BGX34_001418 [Mortierella sp. NVP85]
MWHSSVDGGRPVKGILKRPASQRQYQGRASRLKWDEENLAITEAQKDSTMKIDEPRTPFVRYNPALDKNMDMDESFSLDDINGGRKDIGVLAHTSMTAPIIGDDEDNMEDQEDGGPKDWRDSNEDEDNEEDTEPPPKKGDYERFARMRAEHYKMREALRVGHELVEEEQQALDGRSSNPGPVPPLPSFARQSNALLKES